MTKRTGGIALAIGLMLGGVAAIAEAPAAGAPLFSDMVVDQDPAVINIRDGLTAFSQVNGRWPADLGELITFAERRKLPLDFRSFSRMRYSVDDKDGASVALVEFASSDSGATGAFALTIHTVR